MQGRWTKEESETLECGRSAVDLRSPERKSSCSSISHGPQGRNLVSPHTLFPNVFLDQPLVCKKVRSIISQFHHYRPFHMDRRDSPVSRSVTQNRSHLSFKNTGKASCSEKLGSAVNGAFVESGRSFRLGLQSFALAPTMQIPTGVGLTDTDMLDGVRDDCIGYAGDGSRRIELSYTSIHNLYFHLDQAGRHMMLHRHRTGKT